MSKYLAALAALTSVQVAVALPQSTFLNSCNDDTYLVGDGDPHQNYFEQQVTPPLDCGDGGDGCSVSELTSYTIGWSVNAGVNAGPFITAGFSVSESQTTGDTYTCNAKPNQRVCVWASIPHTAYTVYESVHGTDCGDTAYESDTYVMRSPNTGQNQIRYYCVHDDACRGDGDAYWNYDGRAGGP